MQVCFPVPKVKIFSGRRDFIVQMCHNKRVLHLGCVDEGLLRERFASGDLLHLKLMEVTRELWGLILASKALNFSRRKGFLT